MGGPFIGFAKLCLRLGAAGGTDAGRGGRQCGKRQWRVPGRHGRQLAGNCRSIADPGAMDHNAARIEPSVSLCHIRAASPARLAQPLGKLP